MRVSKRGTAYRADGQALLRALGPDVPQFAGIVTAAFERLAESRELRWICERWFLERLPNGERLNVPMSDELRTNFQVIGLQD